MKGFLSTPADFLADLNLTLHLIMALALLAGAGFARRKDFATHQKIQTAVVLLNIPLIAGIMLTSFLEEVAPGLPHSLVRPRNTVAAVHALLGAFGELLGLFVVLRMTPATRRLIPGFLRFQNVKGVMRFTLGTWWAITLFGLATYYVWYMRPAEPPPTVQTAQPAALGGTATVIIQNFAYQPQDLRVPVGTTVTWVNHDSAPHTVTANDGRFDSKLLDQGQSFSFTFDQVGTFPYYCVFHGNPGAGMTGTVTVLPAEEIVALPTAVTPPTPTPRPSPPPPPTGPLGAQVVGLLAFQDRLGFSDALRLILSGVSPPPPGRVYVGWLTSSTQGPLRLGPIAVESDGRVAFNYHDPNHQNLLVTYEGVQITLEPASGGAQPSGPPVYAGSLPTQALTYLRTLVASAADVPFQRGYAIGIRANAEEVLRQAQAAQAGAQAGDLASVRRHAEVIVNIIEGKEGRDYGDLDKDGRTLDPSDGFGLLQGGARAGYLEAADQAARGAAAAPDATEAIQVHTGHVQVCVTNLLGWTEQARDTALAIVRAADLNAAQPLVQELLALSQSILYGMDANGDGRVEATPGEGGALVLYQHAQYAAAIGIAPSPPTPTATPAPTATIGATLRFSGLSFAPPIQTR